MEYESNSLAEISHLMSELDAIVSHFACTMGQGDVAGLKDICTQLTRVAPGLTRERGLILSTGQDVGQASRR